MVLGPWTDIPGGVGVHLRVVQCRKRRTSPGLGNHQVMPIMLDPKGETQQKQSSGCSFRSMWQTMHLLNKAFTTKLWQPVLVIHLPPHPAHTPFISTLPTPRLILQQGLHCISSQAVKPGRGSGGDAPSLPNSWVIKMWIKNLVPLQMPSVFCLRHSRGGRGQESTGGYPHCWQALTAHSEVCASAASGFAAQPGLPAVWVVQHVLQCCLPAAVWRYSSQELNACRWLQQHSQGRLTAV